jgi:hypothetical protein
MQLTTNTRAFIEAEQYSDFILMNLHDGLLGEVFYRNVADFGSGTTLHIKTIGTVTIQEAAEDTPLTYSPIESGEITFVITDYVGDAWYVTDDLREDGTDIDRLMAERSAESTRAIQEHVETRMLATAAAVYDATSGPYNINGFAHKIVSAQANGLFQLEHLIRMRLAFDKANVPAEGRVFVADPVVEATLNGLVTITSDVTPFAANILANGLARGMRIVGSLYGWDIVLSNRLPIVASANDGTTTLSNVRANLFFCVADDQTKPLMFAWRRMPKVEGERNKDRARDEYVTRARFGWGVQRMDTLGVLYTHQTNIK